MEATTRKILTVSEDTRLYKFIRYIEPAVGKALYWTWKGGDVPDGPGAYAFNGPVPDVSVVIERGLFCAAVPNLALRCDGKRVPTKGNPHYDGGIAAYFTGMYGPGYFAAYDVPFNLATAKKWATTTRSGVLLGKGYWGEQLSLQGHTGILLPSGYVLQSSPLGGLNWNSHIDSEWHYWAQGGTMTHPVNWIEYNDPDDVPEWAKKAGKPSPGHCVGH
jgi:hypothetical protein